MNTPQPQSLREYSEWAGKPPVLEIAADEIERLTAELAGLKAAEGEPVAFCELTPCGNIAYFDGKPMVMTGPVGNDCHPTPLYTHPQPAAPVVAGWQPIAEAPKSSLHILAHGDGDAFTRCCFIASWGGEGRGWLESYTGRPAMATHYMPLPLAPAPTQEQPK